MLYFTSDCTSAPAAKLQSNIFGTHYEMMLDSSVNAFDKSWEADRRDSCAAGSGQAGCGGRGSGGDSLVEILYKTRLKGFMRPRRCSTAPPFPAYFFLEHHCLKRTRIHSNMEIAAHCRRGAAQGIR